MVVTLCKLEKSEIYQEGGVTITQDWDIDSHSLNLVVRTVV